MSTDDSPTVGFVCVQNAGRSQMAAAFAERERDRRGLPVEVLAGGTDPADAVHDNVVWAMRDVGIDLGDRVPREITPEEIDRCEYVITMGCSADGVCPATWRGDARDWDLDDPHGADPERTAEIRDEIERRVRAFFDELAAEWTGRTTR